MADKFRRVIPLKITMSDGEQPTAQKITAIGEQVRVGMGIVERALGDLWNQSGDSVLLNTPLQIPNLARIIGQNKELNPTIYPPGEEFLYIEYLGSKFENLTEGHLLFPPKDTSWYDATNSAGIFSSAVQQKTTESDVQTAGDWWVDTETGRFRVGTPLTTSDILAYYVDPDADWHRTEDILPGVIPDPRQADFEYLRVSEPTAGTYYIHLPPRRPLTLTNREAPVRYPPTGGAEQTANEGTGTSAPWSYWHDSGAASAAAFYRYQLPKEMLDQWGSYSSGDQLPTGFLWLYDTATQTIVEDALFYYPASGDPWVLEVSSDTFDLSALVTADETEPSYNSGLVLITAGAPLARILTNLVVANELHKHDGSSVLDNPVSHADLMDVDPPTSDYTGESHNTLYPSYLPPWGGSKWAKDNHTSLLSRVGAHASTPRDQYNNAMLGDLLLANADTSGADDYINNALPDNSFKMVFGDTDGSFVRGTPGGQVQVNSIENDILKLTNDNTVEEWDFTLQSSGSEDGALVIHRSANTKRFALAIDGTVYMGSNHNGYVLNPPTDSAVIIRAENYPALTTYDGNSNNRGASLATWSSGETFLSCADDFADNNRTGNSFMNIGGHSGVRLRYGSIGSSPQNKGTIGLELDATGVISMTGDLFVASGLNVGEQSVLGDVVANIATAINDTDTRLEVRGDENDIIYSRIHNVNSGVTAGAALDLWIDSANVATFRTASSALEGLEILSRVQGDPMSLWVRESGGTYRKSLHLDSDGDVGFGLASATNPSYKFHVVQEEDGTEIQAAFFTPSMPTTADRTYRFGQDTSDCATIGFSSTTTTEHAFLAKGAGGASDNALYIDVLGNVGIGLKDAENKLEVDGSINVRGDGNSLIFSADPIPTPGGTTKEHIWFEWNDTGSSSQLTVRGRYDNGGWTNGNTIVTLRGDAGLDGQYKLISSGGLHCSWYFRAASLAYFESNVQFEGFINVYDKRRTSGEVLGWVYRMNSIDPQAIDNSRLASVMEDFLGPTTIQEPFVLYSNGSGTDSRLNEPNGVIRLVAAASISSYEEIRIGAGTNGLQYLPFNLDKCRHVTFRVRAPVAPISNTYGWEVGIKSADAAGNEYTGGRLYFFNGFRTTGAWDDVHIRDGASGNTDLGIQWGTTTWWEFRFDLTSGASSVRLYYRTDTDTTWTRVSGTYSLPEVDGTPDPLFYTPFVRAWGSGTAGGTVDIDFVKAVWERD